MRCTTHRPAALNVVADAPAAVNSVAATQLVLSFDHSGVTTPEVPIEMQWIDALSCASRSIVRSTVLIAITPATLYDCATWYSPTGSGAVRSTSVAALFAPKVTLTR